MSPRNRILRLFAATAKMQTSLARSQQPIRTMHRLKLRELHDIDVAEPENVLVELQRLRPDDVNTTFAASKLSVSLPAATTSTTPRVDYQTLYQTTILPKLKDLHNSLHAVPEHAFSGLDALIPKESPRSIALPRVGSSTLAQPFKQVSILSLIQRAKISSRKNCADYWPSRFNLRGHTRWKQRSQLCL